MPSEHRHEWSIDVEAVPHSDPRVREKHPDFYANRIFAWCECGQLLNLKEMTEILNKYAPEVDDADPITREWDTPEEDEA